MSTLAAELGLEPRPDNPYRNPALSVELGVRVLSAWMTGPDWAEVLVWYARGADSWMRDLA